MSVSSPSLLRQLPRWTQMIGRSTTAQQTMQGCHVAAAHMQTIGLAVGSAATLMDSRPSWSLQKGNNPHLTVGYWQGSLLPKGQGSPPERTDSSQ
eukprot:849907-Prorocentrum_minimum.AAC.1